MKIFIPIIIVLGLILTGCYTRRDLVREHRMGELEAAVQCGDAPRLVSGYQSLVATYQSKLNELGQLNRDGSLKNPVSQVPVPPKKLRRKRK